MRIRHGRTIVAASILSVGLVTWSGCSTENSDGTPTPLGTLEEKGKKFEKKAEAGLKKAGEEIKAEAKVIGKEIKEDTKAAGEKIEAVAKEAGKEIKEGVEKAKEAVSDKKAP